MDSYINLSSDDNYYGYYDESNETPTVKTKG